MSGRDIVFRNDKWYYSLERDCADGSLYLDMLCGGVGMYTKIVRLNDEQVEGWVKEGEPYIHDLALRLMRE